MCIRDSAGSPLTWLAWAKDRKKKAFLRRRAAADGKGAAMKAELISVGTELLLGDILNTNAQYLSKELAALGITVHRESVIGDNPDRLAQLVEDAKGRSDLLLFTGGPVSYTHLITPPFHPRSGSI